MANTLGLVLALLGAVALAAQVFCVRLGTRTGTSTRALVVVLLVNVVVLVPYAVVAGYPSYGLTPTAVIAFAAAGFVGTLLGRVFYYAAIERVGASRAEPIKASQPLHATVIAVVVLGETLTAGHLVGIVLIALGIGALSREIANEPTETGERVPGLDLALPLAAAFLFGVEPTLAKLGLAEGTPVHVGLAVKTVAATIGFLSYLRWRGTLPAPGDLAGENLGWYLAAGVANTSFLAVYYAALALAPVVLVVPIIQLSPLLVIVVSVLFLQHIERVTWRLAAASLVVVVGAVAVTAFG